MRLAVCCKQALYAEALASLLNHEGRFDVVATVDSTRKCIEASKDAGARVLVVDTLDLEESELEFLMGARAYGDFSVVLLRRGASNNGMEEADRVCTLNQGGQGLIKAIQDVGNAFVRGPAGGVREARRSYGRSPELSRREFDVASLIAKGYPNRKISQTVGLREQSVKNLVSVIMRKLQCENRVQVALRLSSARISEAE